MNSSDTTLSSMVTGDSCIGAGWYTTSICNAIESHDTWVALGNNKCIYSSERRRAAGLVTFKPSALALQVAVRQLRMRSIT